MKIIKLDEKNPYALTLYDALDKILYFGNEYLPFIFLKKVYLDGHVLQLPRWITKQHMDSIDADVQDLMNNLNWEDDNKGNN
jgi:hypothetical protein